MFCGVIVASPIPNVADPLLIPREWLACFDFLVSALRQLSWLVWVSFVLWISLMNSPKEKGI